MSESELRRVDGDGVGFRDVGELHTRRLQIDGFWWLAIGSWSAGAERLLTEEFAFVVAHTPEIGERGHVHHLELDQLIGEHILVTVHGPLVPHWTKRLGWW